MSNSDYNQLVKEITELVDKMAEISYTAAEHHPYWKLLYSCVEISKTTLEKWNSGITSDEFDEILWHVKELKNTCEKFSHK